MSNLSATDQKRFERRVSVLFVKKDMFICRLDRPWIDTPFWLQGFRLQTDEELDALQRFCRSVYIDISRGIEAEFYMEENLQVPSTPYLEKQLKRKHPLPRYKSKVSLKNELKPARSSLEQASSQYEQVIQNFRNNIDFEIQHIHELIAPLIESVMRNADALPLLSRLRNCHISNQDNAIDTCINAISFGRFMGLRQSDLKNFAAGALLFDIGKVKIPKGIWNKPENLTNREYALAYTHVEQALKTLKQDENTDESIINMVLTHHERADGSGYPNGLKLKLIPAYGKVAAVIDCYNAMYSVRPYKESSTPHAALQEIYSLREKFFQPEVVEKFLHNQGIYPNGSLIEFKSGVVGLVLAQNHSSRIRPQVLLLLDERKKPFGKLKGIDLSSKVNSENKSLTILKDLKHDSHGINLMTVYEKLDSAFESFSIELPLSNPKISLLDKFLIFIEDRLEQIKNRRS